MIRRNLLLKFLLASLVKCASRFLAVAAHVHIYNVLMHSHFSWWMRKNPHGFALSVINLQHSTNSSLMGKTFSLYSIIMRNWEIFIKYYLKTLLYRGAIFSPNILTYFSLIIISYLVMIPTFSIMLSVLL